MRLHSDILTERDIYAAVVKSYESNPAGGGYFTDAVVAHGSRIRDHAFEIALEGFGSRHTRARAWGQGSYGKGSQEGAPRAATYDDWGWFIAHLFAVDPNAVFGPYKGQDDFDARTKFAFVLDDGIVTTVAPEPFEVIAVGTYDGDADRLVLAAFTGDPR